MTPPNTEHPSVEVREARDTIGREETPLTSLHGGIPAADRPDPVAVLEEQNASREQDWCRCAMDGCWLSLYNTERIHTGIGATPVSRVSPTS